MLETSNSFPASENSAFRNDIGNHPQDKAKTQSMTVTSRISGTTNDSSETKGSNLDPAVPAEKLYTKKRRSSTEELHLRQKRLAYNDTWHKDDLEFRDWGDVQFFTNGRPDGKTQRVYISMFTLGVKGRVEFFYGHYRPKIEENIRADRHYELFGRAVYCTRSGKTERFQDRIAEWRAILDTPDKAKTLVDLMLKFRPTSYWREKGYPLGRRYRMRGG